MCPVRPLLTFQYVRLLRSTGNNSVAGHHYRRLSKAHLNRSRLHNWCVGGSALVSSVCGHAGSDGSDQERNGPKSGKDGYADGTNIKPAGVVKECQNIMT